ncbi:MAG: FAD/NAD(P)-binding protein [Acidimicrobiales bacterium]
MTEVAIVGLGPWGLAVLERLVTGAIERSCLAPALTVHVIEPDTPGPGIYGGEQPDYLILNTPCGQHSMYPYPELAAGRLATGFFPWAVDSGYQWVGDRCERTTSGTPLTPHDFLPRRLMGEYLAWFYGRLVHEAPPTVRIVHRSTWVDDLVDKGDREEVHLATGAVLTVDHVVVTTGHTGNQQPAHTCGSPTAAPAYPVTRLGRTVPAGSSVAVRGMGLVAIDVVTSLTTGRGGTFVRRGGRLRYRPSGEEPRLALFSRSGYPYCAKSLGSADLTGRYEPRIFTPETAISLRERPIDARQALVPLLLAEMTTCFYAQSARLDGGDDAADEAAENLARACRRGCFGRAVAGYAARYGAFDAAAHLFAGEGEAFVSSKDYQSRVTEMLASDVAEALVPDGASPVKMAYEVLRVLRDTIRTTVEFGGLTLASHRDFQANVRPRVARIVAGPPVYRSEQLLALIEAEVVRMPFGPSPSVTADGDGVLVASRSLDRPYAERFDRLVAAHLDEPSVHRSSSPVLHRLHERGRLDQFRLEGEELGSVQLTEEFHPVTTTGAVEDRLWVFGGLTEGPRYYTAYIPSPASRVRAFVDAGLCADRILGGSR